MKKHIKLNEAQLRNMVAECVEKTLKEFISPVQPATDYEGNDLNYEHLFDEALKVIDEMNDGATEIKWQDVAQRMGYHLDTLNEDDIELLHDAIEDAMAVPGIEEEPIQVNETKIAKIVAESVKKVLKEWEKPSDWKETEFQGTYTDDYGSLYMPDDDYEDYEVEQCVNELKPLILKLSQSYTTEQIEAALEKILKLGV